MRRKNDIHELARGRWQDILTQIGISKTALSGKHGSCVICGGKDRWRWDDKGGNGTFFCTHCGSGNGVDLTMKFLGVNFITAKQEIEKYLPLASRTFHKATQSTESIKQWAAELWARANRLSGDDPASRYLASRGLNMCEYPTQIRYCSRLTYKHEDGTKTKHPGMIAKMHSPDAKDWTVHMTYLTDDGCKADLEKVKKLAPLPVPVGGSVRLAQSSETMGVAEGIETALSAQLLFGIPVWAALSTAGLMKWSPPQTARNIIVFSDCDESYAGQMAAYSLAYKLRGEGLGVEVRMPEEIGSDWNDHLMGERAHLVAAE